MPDLAGPKIGFFGFTGMIESGGVTRIASAFNTAVNQGYDEIHLTFSSGGGFVSDGIFLHNHIRSLPIKTVIYNTGTVASIAAAIFVAADERYCSANAIFMIHPTSFTSSQSMTATGLQSSLEAALADDNRTESILRQRTSIPDAVLKRRLSGEVYMAAGEAVAYGIAQEIREFTLPRGNQIYQI